MEFNYTIEPTRYSPSINVIGQSRLHKEKCVDRWGDCECVQRRDTKIAVLLCVSDLVDDDYTLNYREEQTDIQDLVAAMLEAATIRWTQITESSYTKSQGEPLETEECS